MDERVVHVDESQLEDQSKMVNVRVDSNTGEKQILGETEIEDKDKSFEEKASDTINNISLDLDRLQETVTMEEISEMIIDDDSFLKQLTNGTDLTQDDIKGILNVTNKVIKKEPVDNIYKELPEIVQTMIDNYILAEFKGIPINQRNMMRKTVTNSLVNRFIDIIKSRRSKYDFAHALANIYKEGNKELENAAMEAHKERNKVYREIAEDIEDPEKKKRMLDILDRIDEAKNLTELKEFAKKCKIKSIELEKPRKVYTEFLNKYRNSANNIYDVEIAYKAMLRNIGEGYSEKEVAAFYIAFCKQVQKYNESNPLDHAYMYYVLYYSVLTDSEDSKEFIDNVKEVINNIKERNSDRFR